MIRDTNDKWLDFREGKNSPVTGLSYKNVESLLQPYSIFLAAKFVTSSLKFLRHVHVYYYLTRDVLASSVISPAARTSSCNSRGRRKAAPYCARLKSQKVETIERIETVDPQSIRSIPRVTNFKSYSVQERLLLFRQRQFEQFKQISKRSRSNKPINAIALEKNALPSSCASHNLQLALRI